MTAGTGPGPDAAGSSMATGSARPAGRSSSVAVVATTTAARLSASRNAIRPGGSPGSTGSQAAPACQTASIAVIMSAPRGRHSPTTVSGPAPSPASRAASWPDRTTSSR
jgi:hypothetical protein